MKFPKSVHPEGWLAHIDRDPAATAARPAGAALKPRSPRPSAKIRATDPLGAEPPPAMAATLPPPAASRRAGNSAMPWIVGAVAGAALIGGAALTMSHQTAAPEAPAMSPLLLGEVSPPAASAASSAEDGLLAQAPTAAGPDVPVTAPPQPSPQPAPKLAEARKAEVPAAVARELAPPPEPLAQPSPPLALLREPTPAAAPATPLPAEPVVTPPPAAEPVLAQTPSPAADSADVGITVKVREALASDAALAALPIAVSTDHGVVKLEGQAPDAQTRERATVVAAATTGVRGVDNRLTLAGVTVGALQGHGS